MGNSASWNSLEIVKLVVSILTPLIVALIGIGLARVTKRLEASQWVNQKLIEKRIDLMEHALPELNDLYCYFVWIGNWKELSPVDVIQRKRGLDRLFFANRSFFSADTLAKYKAFSSSLFKTYAAPGVDARLRTGQTSHDGDRERSYPGTWQQEWTTMFTDNADQASRQMIKERYDALMDRLGSEVGADLGHDGGVP